jgi:hypothetical protein
VGEARIVLERPAERMREPWEILFGDPANGRNYS